MNSLAGMSLISIDHYKTFSHKIRLFGNSSLLIIYSDGVDEATDLSTTYGSDAWEVSFSILAYALPFLLTTVCFVGCF